MLHTHMYSLCHLGVNFGCHLFIGKSISLSIKLKREIQRVIKFMPRGLPNNRKTIDN